MEKKGFAIVLIIAGLVGLDAYTLLYSFWHPWLVAEHFYIYNGQTIHIAQPFSAYYNSAWNFIHNPGDLYNTSTGYPIPNGEGLRYPPFFLLFVLPLLRLPYDSALQAFATFQFLLLPLIAALAWKILSPKSTREYMLLALVLIMTLWTPLEGYKGNWFYLLHGISGPYFGEFQDGESKILELFIILGALYFAKRNSIFAGFLLVLSSFDPRFTLMAVPLFAYLMIKNRGYLKALEGIAFGALILFVPFLFYYNTLGQYFALNQYNVTIFYAYEWIPFYAILSLTIAFFVQEYWRARPKIEPNERYSSPLVTSQEEGN